MQQHSKFPQLGDNQLDIIMEWRLNYDECLRIPPRIEAFFHAG